MYKKCARCHKNRPLVDYAKNTLWCRQCYAAHRLANKEKRKLYNYQWAKNNPEKYLEIRHRSNRKNKDKIDEYNLEYRTANRDVCRKAASTWAKNNPERVKLNNADRKAAKINATPLWADREIMELVYVEADYRKASVDHIVPLRSESVCGLHVYYNTQLLTVSENAAKGNRWPYEPRVPL
jgi:hypothetical protein